MGHYIFTLTLPDATGASRMVVHHAAAFRRRGHRVTVVHGPPPANEATILPELGELGVALISEPRLAFPMSPLLLRRLTRLFRAEQAQAVIGVQQRDRAIALHAAHLAGVPGFVNAGNTHVFWGRWPINRLKEQYYAWSLRQYAKLVVCVSPIIQGEMIERFGLPKERTAYIPSAVDLSAMQSASPDEARRVRRELGISDDELMLVNVGRINKQKGQDLLIDAFRRVSPGPRPVKLVLVGGVSQDGAVAEMQRYHDQLVASVRRHRLEDRVIFAGWRRDVPALLAACDGYVHSARWEGFGIASFEAMAASRATIWTNCWGRPEGFVDGEHGWLVPTDSVEALHGALEKLVHASDEERRAIGAASQEFVGRYDSRAIAERFVDAIELASA